MLVHCVTLGEGRRLGATVKAAARLRQAGKTAALHERRRPKLRIVVESCGGGEFEEVLDVRAGGAVEALHLWIGGFDDVVFVGGVGAAAVA